MATYIKGVTDVLPGPKAMAPDYALLSTALTTLQNKYDKGFDQVKSMYTSLINSGLSSSDNEKFRQDYLKKADSYLSQLSGVDLSNANNVSQALRLFDPLIDDKQYSRDLYLTKAQDNEIQKMRSVKQSTDPKVYAQYNPTMEEYLMIGKERLSEMKRDDGSIERASYNQFIPWQDPIEYAKEVAGKEGLEVKYTEQDGYYLIKTLNGQRSENTFKNWFLNTVGNRFDNQFRIEGVVRHEREIRGTMAQNPNMNRGQAIEKLAQDFSGKYLTAYDEQISELQQTADEIDRTIRLTKRASPNGADAKTLAYLDQLSNRRTEALNLKNKLSQDRGTDDALKAKGAQMYTTNAAGLYMDEIKKDYARRFAYNQAYGKQSYDIEADQVKLQFGLQNDRQAHDWAMEKARQNFELEKQRRDQEAAVQLALLKKEIPGVDTGAQIGQAQDVGAYSLDQTYNRLVSQSFTNGLKAYADPQVLAVAGGYNISKGGVIAAPANSVDISNVSAAITNIANKKPLTTAQKSQLVTYLNGLGTGKTYTQNSNITFAEIQAGITQAVRKNKNNYPDLAVQITRSLDASASARTEYANMYNQNNKHLYDLYRTDSAAQPYIKFTANGVYSINYDKLNDLDAEERAAMLEKLIPDAEMVRSKSSTQMNTIVLNPSDPDKFDYNILASVINNATNIGVTVEGELNEYDEDQIREFREKVVGSANMKEVFDPNQTTYQRVAYNNQDYIKVTIPVKRDATSGNSMATKMSFDLSKDIATSNNIEFYVPVSKVRSIAGNDATYRDVTGNIKTIPNDLRKMLMSMAGESLVGQPLSWVSRGGLLKDGKSLLPENDYGYKIRGGSVVRTGADENEIRLNVYTDDGKYQSVSITDQTGITFNELQMNPGMYDDKIRGFVDNIVASYDARVTQAAQQQHTTNKLKTGLTPWSKTQYANY